MIPVLARICADLGLPEDAAATVGAPPHPVPLPSHLATAELAWASLCSVLLSAGFPADGLPDPDRIAAAYRSDRLLRIDGAAPETWAPLSGFHRTSDGWVRTHANYPHHARALREALGLAEDASAMTVDATFASDSTASLVSRITAAGGLAVPVLTEVPAVDAAWRRSPVIEVTEPDRPMTPASHGNAPLAGIRVLDLTRVIAGPVCTRTLAALGADVLRVDPPHLPEIAAQHLDTGHGKRTTVLDARSRAFDDLLASADVVVLGYRPAALEHLGLSPAELAERHPGLVIAQLSAWGAEAPDRRGFDSLVQAECGIAMIESADGESPGALPAQALDHSAGYLLAAAVCAAVRRTTGHTQVIGTSLRRVAAELLGMPRKHSPVPATADDPALHTEDFATGGHTVTTARSAIPGHPFSAPRPWGGDPPTW